MPKKHLSRDLNQPASQKQLLHLEQECLSLQAKKQQLQNSLATIEEKIAAAKGLLDDLQADYETRRTKLDNELKDVLLKIQDKHILLKQISEDETAIREALATERLKLQKDKQALNQNRGRAAKHGVYMNL